LERQRAIPWSLAIWLASSAVGGLVIALPDTGPRLFSLSEAHGPSLVDGAGIAIVLGGYAWFLRTLVRHRATAKHLPTSHATLLGLAFGLGLGLVIASVASDFGQWWAVGAFLAFAAQVILALLVQRSGAASSVATNASPTEP
jgi:nitrate reductase gamma subunit